MARIVGLLVTALCLTAGASAQAVRPLSIDDALDTRTFGYFAPVDLSPDGRWVAYTVSNPRRLKRESRSSVEFQATGIPSLAEGTELWVTHTSTGESHNLTGDRGVSWGGVWSPDGRTLAFYSDRDGLQRVWIWDRRTGQTRRLSAAVAHPFYLFETVQWTPDGRHLLVKLLPEGGRIEGEPDSPGAPMRQPATESGSTVTIYRSAHQTGAPPLPPTSTLARSTADLSLVSVATGTVIRMVSRAPVMRYLISPTGRDIAYTTLRGFDPSDPLVVLYDVAVISTETMRSRTLASSVPHDWGPAVSWSPDGQSIAYTTKPHPWSFLDAPEKELPAGDCFIVATAGGTPRRITVDNGHPDFGTNFRPPVWNLTGSHVYLLGSDTLWRISVADGTRTAVGTVPGRRLLSAVTTASGAHFWDPHNADLALIRTFDEATLRTGVARISLETGQAALLFEDDAALMLDRRATLGSDAESSTIIYLHEDAQHPADLWVAGPDFTVRRRLTHLNPQLDKYAFGKSRIIEWISADGDSLRGALLLPASYSEGRRYPLVVWVYGGERQSRMANSFGVVSLTLDYLQLLSTRGYAVLIPDAPQRVGTPMLDLAKAVLPAVSRVIELGIGDPARVGIMGQSYGCYSTLALIVQTTRFKAAVCTAGPTNLIAMYGTVGGAGAAWATSGQGLMGGGLWDRRDRYIENSPLFYLDRVQTPVLLMHGTADRAVPSFIGDEVYTALHSLGKTVVYARYEGEGHAPMLFSLPNLRDYFSRLLAWFGTYLVPEP